MGFLDNISKPSNKAKLTRGTVTSQPQKNAGGIAKSTNPYNALNKISKAWIKFRFNAAVRRNLYQSFVDYLSQGIPINNIVQQLSTAIKRANAKSQMFQVKILQDIELQMSAGVDFTDAIKEWVPINEAMSIRAGMKSGEAATGMINTIASLDSAGKMKGTIFGKLSYPAVLLSALTGLIFFFSVQIIPQIAGVMDPMSWPESAKPLYDSAVFVQNKWSLVLFTLIGIGVGINATMGRVTGPIRKILDKLPPWNFYKAFHGANLLISLASLMRSGVPLDNALRELRRMATPYIQWHLDQMIFKLADGRDVGEVLDTGLLSQEMMVNVYMMTGNANFQAAVYEIGKQAVEKGIDQISKIAGAISGMALLGVAMYIGWVYYCFFTVSNAMATQA